MSLSPVIALRRAMRARLAADSALVALLGGAKIYDEAPRGADPPYVLFAEARLRDWSVSESMGAEQLVILSAVSVQRGVAEPLAVAQRIAELLDEATLTLTDHRLIDLRLQSQETRREQNGRFARVDLRFRATTEVL